MIPACSIVESPAGPQHLAFVADSFRHSLRQLSHVSDVPQHVAMLARTFRGGIGRTVVATLPDHPDTFLGWAAALYGSLVFCYVPSHLRRLGIARQMVADLFGAGGPVRLVYWTETAERIARQGFPLVHDWREFARRSRAAERLRRRQSQPQLLEERLHA